MGAINLIPARVLWGATAPSNMLTRALIGFGDGARGESNLAFRGSRLVGLCDVDATRVEEGLALSERAGWGRVKAYCDFRDLLSDPGVDIVHICTPTHWHGVMSVMTARAGKDVWCECPMTRTVGEGARVKEYLASKGTIFGLDAGFRFHDPFYGFGRPVQPVFQLVENGFFGKGPLKCVCGVGQGFDWKFRWSGLVNAPVEAVPPTLDWDMWLGPAPFKPYTRHRCHATFRGYWDYDAGVLGEVAQQYLDPIQFLLGKDATSPVRIDYKGPCPHPEAVGRFRRITLAYADGTEVVLDGDGSLSDEPFLRGANGWTLWPCPEKLLLLNEKGMPVNAEAMLKSLPPSATRQADFLESVRTRRRFGLDEVTGFRSCALGNLAAVAQRLGRGFAFDPVTLHAKDDEAAERYLYQEDAMREPWRGEFFSS